MQQRHSGKHLSSLCSELRFQRDLVFPPCGSLQFYPCPPLYPVPPLSSSARRENVLPISGTQLLCEGHRDNSWLAPAPPSSLWTLFRLTGKDLRLFASFQLGGILEDYNFVCSLLDAVASSNTSVIIFCILSIANISSSTAGSNSRFWNALVATAPAPWQWLSPQWTSQLWCLGCLSRCLFVSLGRVACTCWTVRLAQCVADSLEATDYCWVIMKLNLMIMR